MHSMRRRNVNSGQQTGQLLRWFLDRRPSRSLHGAARSLIHGSARFRRTPNSSQHQGVTSAMVRMSLFYMVLCCACSTTRQQAPCIDRGRHFQRSNPNHVRTGAILLELECTMLPQESPVSFKASINLASRVFYHNPV